MYAVIQTGGKQYKVENGTTLLIEKMDVKAGEEVILDKVLMIGDGEKATIGRPTVDGAKVLATVVRQMRAPKLIVFKKRSKKGYKKMQGHRQNLTEIIVKEIQG